MQKFFLPVVILFCIFALAFPESFNWGKSYIPYFLGLIMFGMGASLSTDEFLNVFKNWKGISIGVAANYIVMPLIAFILGCLFHLEKEVFIGLILVGCCPSGTASNVMTYIAKGNLALSVTMTLVSTMLAPLLTPVVFYLIAGEMIHISFLAMVTSIFWIVVFPLIDGLIVRHFFKPQVDKLLPYLPGFSLFVIAFVIAVVVALNRENIIKFQVFITLAVILHNISGFSVGYLIGKLFKMEDKDIRAMAIEIGMQNSGLGAALALKFFAVQAALPSALFSLWQNISGSMLAKYLTNKSSRSVQII